MTLKELIDLTNHLPRDLELLLEDLPDDVRIEVFALSNLDTLYNNAEWEAVMRRTPPCTNILIFLVNTRPIFVT